MMAKLRCELRAVLSMALIMGLSWFPGAKADLNDGLVAYYPFDGNANDASGNGNDGTEHGGIEYIDGVIGNAVSLDGIDDYIQVPLNDTLKFNPNKASFSIVAWAKPKSANDTDGRGCQMTIVPIVDTYTFYLYNGGLGVKRDYNHQGGVGSERIWDEDNWHLFVGTWDVGSDSITGKTYVDGELEGTARQEIIPNGSYPWRGLYMGATQHCTSWSQLSYGEADLDEVRIYNRPLSECEIQSLYTGKDECIPNLVELANFTATPIQNGIRLDWETISELDTAGYFVWRGTPLKNGECSNDSSNYNDIMQLSFDKSRGDLSSGATYSRTDYSVISGTTYCYLLEDVEFDGDSKFHWKFIDSATAQ
ncbi:MAG: LamG domain-containing protein [Candidatus Parabeggiatoa sp.]|nr:LamG domain-containing protein [Candidatus Parabeggiatoa sp.]